MAEAATGICDRRRFQSETVVPPRICGLPEVAVTNLTPRRRFVGLGSSGEEEEEEKVETERKRIDHSELETRESIIIIIIIIIIINAHFRSLNLQNQNRGHFSPWFYNSRVMEMKLEINLTQNF